MVSPENSNYWSHFDYATLIDDIPVPDDPYAGFSWSTQPIDAPSNVVRYPPGKPLPLLPLFSYFQLGF